MTRSRSLQLVLLALAAAFCLAAVVTDTSWQHPTHGVAMTDWLHYAMSWQRVAAGGPLYNPIEYSGQPFTFPDMLFVGWAYPPPAIIFFAPFASWPAGWVAWTVVNLGLLLTGLWAIVSLTWPRERIVAMALVLVGLGLWEPSRNAMVLDNADLAVAGLAAWAWIGPPRITGLAGAIGGVLKIAPGALLLFGLRNGWRSALPGIAVGVLLCIVTLPLVGLDAWGQYAVALTNATAPCRPANVALACWLPDGRLIGLLLAGMMGLGAWLIPNRTLAFSLAAMAYPVANHDLRLHTWAPLFVVGLVVVTQIARHVALSTPPRPPRAAASEAGRAPALEA